MSATFDVAASNHNNSVTSIPVNITVNPAGVNRILKVSVTTVNGESITSITGAGATWQPSAFGTIAGAGGARGETWYGIAPSTGAQTVTVNFSASLGGEAMVDVESWSDVDQATPLANYDGFNPGSNANVNRNVTTVAGDGASCQLADASGSATCVPAIDANETFQTGGAYQVSVAHTIAVGASTNFAWTNTNGKVYQGVAIKQAASGPSAAQRIGIFDQQLSGSIIGRVDA